VPGTISGRAPIIDYPSQSLEERGGAVDLVYYD
jgi:hypothetical protein